MSWKRCVICGGLHMVYHAQAFPTAPLVCFLNPPCYTIMPVWISFGTAADTSGWCECVCACVCIPYVTPLTSLLTWAFLETFLANCQFRSLSISLKQWQDNLIHFGHLWHTYQLTRTRGSIIRYPIYHSTLILLCTVNQFRKTSKSQHCTHNLKTFTQKVTHWNVL